MSLSKKLQAPEYMEAMQRLEIRESRQLFLQKTVEWYKDNKIELELLRSNLEAFSLPIDENVVNSVIEHIAYHYHEKLIPFKSSPEWYANYLETSVDDRNELDKISNSITEGRSPLVVISHFGAIELVVPSISLLRKPISIVLRYTTELLSRKAKEQTYNLEKSGYFGKINIIEIGKPGSYAALEMSAALGRGDILVSVFDEETEYSRPVSLLGRKVLGGAGLDKLLKFTKADVQIFNAFMIRTGEDKYKLSVMNVNSERMLENMFENLENTIKKHPEQWYFLHEEIPFA